MRRACDPTLKPLDHRHGFEFTKGPLDWWFSFGVIHFERLSFHVDRSNVAISW